MVLRLPLSLPARDARRFDVVGLGEASLDLVAVTDGWPPPNAKMALHDFRMLPGGQTATAIVASARLGCRSRFVGAFGDDEFGTRVTDALKSEGVEVTAVRRPGTPSRFAAVLVDRRSGERTILERRDARLAIDAGDFDSGVFTSGRLLMVDATDVPASTRAARAARAAGVRTIVDVESPVAGLDELLEQIDVIIAAGSFPVAYTGASTVAQGLRALGERFRPAIAVATMGEEGSVAWCQTRVIRTPAHPVTAVDTTGAGDAFRGGFAAGWLELGDGAEVERLLTYANRVAGLNCRAIGAQTGLPTRAEAGGV